MSPDTIVREFVRVLLKMLPLGRTADDIINLIYNIRSSERELDKQVEEAVEALTTSTNLIANLESSLEARSKKLNELKAEYERVSELAELTEEQGAAITKTLEQALGKNQGRDRWIAFAINVAAGLLLFIVGVFASDWVKNIPRSFTESETTELIDPSSVTKETQ